MFVGVPFFCQEGGTEALLCFSRALVLPRRRDRGADVRTTFCNEIVVIQVTGISCCGLFNIAGLLSFASQLELRANADPCEPY